jgi:hypothetical protein
MVINLDNPSYGIEGLYPDRDAMCITKSRTSRADRTRKGVSLKRREENNSNTLFGPLSSEYVQQNALVLY